MQPQKNWKEMFADLQAEIDTDRTQAAAETARGDIWAERLYTVFNSKAANRIVPRIGSKARQEYRDIAQQGIALVNDITGKILKKELSVAELNMIAAHARDIAPVDGMMFGLLQPVAFAAHEALQMAMDAEEPAREARREDIRQKERAVFRSYLRENPQSARLIAAMMSDDGAIHSAASIAQRNPGVTWQQLQAVVDEVTPILTTSFSLSPFTVFRTLQKQFRDLPEAERQEQHYTRYYGFSGSKEIRAEVKAAAASRPAPQAPKR